VKKKTAKVNSDKGLSQKAGGGERKTAIRFKTLVEIRRFLARTLNALDADKIPEGKARAIGYLCSVMRDIIKDSDLEARVLKLEREMEKREST
jgi:hypothetical protein